MTPTLEEQTLVAKTLGFRLVEVPCVCDGTECGGPWKLIEPDDVEGEQDCVQNFTQSTPERAWDFGLPAFDDDRDAVRWLLPWLKKHADANGLVLHIVADEFSGFEASLWPRDSPAATLSSGHSNQPTSFASALFHLCLAIIQQEQSA